MSRTVFFKILRFGFEYVASSFNKNPRVKKLFKNYEKANPVDNPKFSWSLNQHDLIKSKLLPFKDNKELLKNVRNDSDKTAKSLFDDIHRWVYTRSKMK